MFQYLFEGINNKSINDKTIHKLKDAFFHIERDEIKYFPKMDYIK